MASKFYVEVDGKQIPRSAYVRQLFKEGLSRGEIAKQLGMTYGQVYTSTANMENEHHKLGEHTIGASGVMLEVDGKQIARADYIRQQALAGVHRGDIAKELGVPYSTVWAATKSLHLEGEGFGAKVMLDIDGRQVARADYIRELFNTGSYTRRQIADMIKCDYAVVWAATKPKNVTEADEATAEKEAQAHEAGEAETEVVEAVEGGEGDENYPE